MSKRQKLTADFKKLSPQDITQLSNAKKNQLLLMLLQQINEEEVLHDRAYQPTKIAKWHRRTSYKSFVRRNMPKIIQKLMMRVRKQPSIIYKKRVSKEGKTQFKSWVGKVTRRKIKNFMQGVDSIVNENNKQQFSCSICLEIFIHPILTTCGHTFCLQCLDQSLIFSSNCPNCRENIKGTELITENIIDKLIKKSSFINLEGVINSNYYQRVRKFQEWRIRREIDGKKVKVGDRLDVRDTQNIWCQGTIVQIQYEGEYPSALLIHFNRWNNIYNQIIEIPNLRFAPLHFFSSRTDIPRYNLAQEDNNLRGLVVSGIIVEAVQQQQLMNGIVSDSSSEEESIIEIQPTIYNSNNRIDEILLNNWNYNFANDLDDFQQPFYEIELIQPQPEINYEEIELEQENLNPPE